MGTSLISRNLQQWQKADDFNCLIVSGYKEDRLKDMGYPLITNPIFSKSNMVWSLLMALPQIEKLDDEFIYLSYGDIILAAKNVQLLIDSSADMSVVVDLNWELLWSFRMENYMTDVESLKFSGTTITKKKKKAQSKLDIQGQYIGVLKIRRELLISQLRSYKTWVYDDVTATSILDRQNLYLTDFIQQYIDKSGEVTAVFINGGWLEVDSVQDLMRYEKNWGANSIFSDLL